MTSKLGYYGVLIWFVHMVYVATIILLWPMVCLLLYNIAIAFGVRNTNWVHAAMQWVHAAMHAK